MGCHRVRFPKVVLCGGNGNDELRICCIRLLALAASAMGDGAVHHVYGRFFRLYGGRYQVGAIGYLCQISHNGIAAAH